MLPTADEINPQRALDARDGFAHDKVLVRRASMLDGVNAIETVFEENSHNRGGLEVKGRRGRERKVRIGSYKWRIIVERRSKSCPWVWCAG